MKTKLLLLTALFLLLSINLFSQNTWIGGGSNTNWSNVDNWSAGAVPEPGDNVLIPTGFNVNADSLINVTSLTVEGNSILNIQNGITFVSPSVFRQNTTINWFNGLLNGQGGILTSEGTINALADNIFNIAGSTTLNNLGTINNSSLVSIGIGNNSVINNSGTIDFKINNSSISGFGGLPYVLNNTGLIKTSFPNSSDQASIASQLINTGTLQVEIGTLNLSGPTNLIGGLYHVSAGATLNWNNATTISGIITGNVFGDLNWEGDLLVPTTAFFNFNGNETINWNTGDLGGGGTLTNLSIIDRKNGGIGTIEGATTLDNERDILFTSGLNINLTANSVLNNNIAGVIDFQVDGSNIIGNANLNNFGLIKTSFPNPTDQSIISAQLNNNNGTIQVDNGTLWLSNSNTTLTNGVYNIVTGATLLWTQPITVSGTLNGVLDGNMNWEANLLVPTTASLSFSGSGSVQWSTGFLSGGGVLTNGHVIKTLSGSDKRIEGATALLNNAEFRSSSFIRIGTSSILNNSSIGIIDIQNFGSSFGIVNSAPHAFINSGLIKTSFPSNNSSLISAPVNNFGAIEATTGEIDFSNTLINETSGIIKGIGTIDLPIPANFTNNGTFAPGLSPGVLTILGDYSSSATTVLDIELNGLTQGTGYDVLEINGNGSFDGDVQITLGFDADVNDEFIIATTTGIISNCNLPLTKMVSFNGSQYEFSVACRNNNEVVLTVTNETLGIDSIDDLPPIMLYPNPATDMVSFSENSIKKIDIYDLNGRKILNIKNTNTFSVKSLSSGIYIVKAKNANNNTITKRLIKN